MALILDGTNGLSDVDGSASTPAIRGTDTNTGIFFPAADTIAFAEGGAEVARFDSSGNLGVGTTSPLYKLQVGSFSGNNSIEIAAGTTGESSVFFGDGTSGTDAYRGYLQYQHTSDALLIATSATERMRIDSSGNLLVGTTSEQRSGSTRTPKITAYATNTEGFNSVISDLTYAGWVHTSLDGGTGTHYCAYFENVIGTAVGQITHNGTNTSYTTSSDYRLKDNITPMTGALAVVGQLKPCTYTWKETGQESQGFIAHELAEVVPDAVTGEKDAVDGDGKPQYQGIDTSFLVATLTAAIQEQQAIITDLKSRIEALEAK